LRFGIDDLRGTQKVVAPVNRKFDVTKSRQPGQIA